MCGHWTTGVVLELLCSYWTNGKEKLNFFVFVHRDRIYGLFPSVGQTALKSHLIVFHDPE